MAPKASTHAVYDLKYHFVWIPKYRNQLLVGEVVETTREILPKTAEAYEIEIDTMEVVENHVHFFSICAAALFTCSDLADIEKYLSLRAVCPFPLADRQVVGRGAVGRWLFCPFGR